MSHSRTFLSYSAFTVIQASQSNLPLYLYKAPLFSMCYLILTNLEAGSGGINSMLKTQSEMLTQEDPDLTSSHAHTKSIATHKTIPSRGKKSNCAIPTHQANKKNLILKYVRKTETHSDHKHYHITATYNWEKTSKSRFLPEERRVWIQHGGLYLLRLLPEGQAPKHLAPKANETCVHKTYNTIANKETVLKGLVRSCCESRGLSEEVASKKCLYPSLPLKEVNLRILKAIT